MIITASPTDSETAPAPAFGQAQAARAYGAVRAARSLRTQESEVFALLAGRLRAAKRSDDRVAHARAAADARRLFTTLDSLVVHPSSPLPQDLRVAIATVARRAVQETNEPMPDLEFLAAIADDFAAGLAQEQSAAA